MNYWIEKTLVNGRTDRENGDRALGKALWSPQFGKAGADIYKNMRKVTKGDIILHLVDNTKFAGISFASDKAKKTTGILGTNWDGPAYLIDLEGYVALNPAIDRSEILNQKQSRKLIDISQDSEVFYTYDLKLRQGAYLTPCPEELLSIINKVYNSKTNQNLPYINHLSQQSVIVSERNNDMSVNDSLISSFLESLEQANLLFSKELIIRFISSLLAKPFVLLTGLSGSGKTKLAQAFVKWICENERQFCIVPVGADWTNREPLLGFPNSLKFEEYIKPENRVLDTLLAASSDLRKPYFLILDEMNLSHVERYFADFLSTMESGDEISLHANDNDWNGVPAKISLPKNLFVVGTVNIDETTYMFSPKVLDRANVIEFRVTAEEMISYLKDQAPLNLDALEKQGVSMAEDFIQIANNKILKVKDDEVIKDELINFFTSLKVSGAEFGYRSAAEIFRFAGVVNLLEPAWSKEQILDAAIMQKLLPKVHGSRRKLEPVLKTLGKLCFVDDADTDKYFGTKVIPDAELVKYPISLEKILRMYNGLIDNGFTSYAEA